MDIDLRPMIDRLVEREKEYIREDREEYGCAMALIVAPDGVHLDFPEFEDEESKQMAYQRLVSLAREKNATIIVTLNNAWTRSARDGEDLDDIGAGELNATNAEPCLVLTISGPGIQSQSLEMGYTIRGDEIRFSPLEPMDSCIVNLLPGWSD
jgi:hypothetical protein